MMDWNTTYEGIGLPKMDGWNEGHGPKTNGSKGGGPKIDGGDKGFILGI